MATLTGNWAPNGSNPKRARLRVVYSVSNNGGTQAVVSGTVYVDVATGFAEGCSLNWTGTLLGSGSRGVTVNAKSNTGAAVYTFSKAVNKSSKNQTLSLSFALRNIKFIGSSQIVSVNGKINIPAIPATPPYTPVDVRIANNVLYWNQPNPGSSPVSHFVVTRWLSSTQKWANFATVNNAARSLKISVPEDNSAKFRVFAFNGRGASGASLIPDPVFGLPKADANPRVARSGGKVVVSWDVRSLIATGHAVQGASSSNGGRTWTGWSQVAWVGVGSSTSAAFTIDGTKIWKFRTWVFAQSPKSSTSSMSTETGLLQPVTAPNPPTPLSPVGAQDLDNASIRFFWRHNPKDGTSQSQARMRYRQQGSESWVTVETTTSSAFVLPMTDFSMGAYEWQIATRGEAAAWSGWSSLQPFIISTAPVVEITNPLPDQVLTTTAANLRWSFQDGLDSGQASWVAVLLDEEGQEVATQTGTTERQTRFRVMNQHTYTIRLVVTSGSGLTSLPDEITFSTKYVPPVPLQLSGVWNRATGEIELGVSPMMDDNATYTLVDHWRLERSVEDGPWQVVADDIPMGSGVNDAEVPNNRRVTYRAISVSIENADGTDVKSTSQVVVSPVSSVVSVRNTNRYLAFPVVGKIGNLILAAWGDSSDHYGSAKDTVVGMAVSTSEGRSWTPVDSKITSDLNGMGVVGIATFKNRWAWLGAKTVNGARVGYVRTTTDPTKSWSEPKEVKNWNVPNPFPSDLLWLDDGTLDGLMLAVCYYGGIHITSSSDGGTTWVKWSTPDLTGHSEGTITPLPDGRLLLMGRFDPKGSSTPDSRNNCWFSSDKGRTWSGPYVSGRNTSALPNAIALPDGTVIVPVRDMTEDSTPKSWALDVSPDSGQTWNARVQLNDGFMMYGDFVQLSPTKVLLVGASQVRTSATDSDVWAVQLGVQRRTIRDGSDMSEAVENPGPEWTVTPTSDRIWLTGLDGTKLWLRHNLSINVTQSNDVVFEDYLDQDQPTAHYGIARGAVFQISGLLSIGEFIDSDFDRLKNQPIFYRDPAGRAHWVSLESSGISIEQTDYQTKSISMSLREIERPAQ